MRYLKKTIQFIALLFVAFLINSFAVEHLRAIDPAIDQEQQKEAKQDLPRGHHLTASILNNPFGPAIRGPSTQDPAGIDGRVDSVLALINLEENITVTNTGWRAGTEIVQFYVRDMVGSVGRPVKELKDFEKISLQAGKSKEVSFRLTADDLRFYNRDMKYVAEPGKFQLFVGPNSQEVQMVEVTLE